MPIDELLLILSCFGVSQSEAQVYMNVQSIYEFFGFCGHSLSQSCACILLLKRYEHADNILVKVILENQIIYFLLLIRKYKHSATMGLSIRTVITDRCIQYLLLIVVIYSLRHRQSVSQAHISMYLNIGKKSQWSSNYQPGELLAPQQLRVNFWPSIYRKCKMLDLLASSTVKIDGN